MSPANRPESKAVTRWREWLEILSPEASQEQTFLFRQEIAAKKRSPAWHLVEIPEADLPLVTRYSSLDALAAHVRRLLENDPAHFVVAFYGVQAPLCLAEEQSLRYLQHPGGGLLPLFDSAPVLRQDKLGFLGDPQDPIESPYGQLSVRVADSYEPVSERDDSEDGDTDVVADEPEISDENSDNGLEYPS